MSTKPKPKTKPKTLSNAMQQAGFSKAAAQLQNDFWSLHGIDAIRIGRTKLVVKKAKP